MPIPIVCPGCKKRFSVSEKFAGKKGPCPQCKTVITIPLEAPAEVVIHAPEEFASAGKDSKGRPVSKPILREESKFKPKVLAGIAGAAVVILGLCFLFRGVENKVPLIGIGLLLIAPPICLGGYEVLRNPELGAYHGRELLVRAALCGLVYALLWGVYLPLAPLLEGGEPWQWLLVTPLFVCAGAGAAFVAFDLDFGTGALHYSLFLLVTLILRAAIGIPPVWASVAGTTLESPF